MNAIELLKQDHSKVKQLFHSFESSGDEKEHHKIFEAIKAELQTHSHIEETIFYPAVEDQDHDDLDDLVQGAFDEHAEISDLLDEIDGLKRQGGELRQKIAELKEKVEHHVEEEENEMFPKLGKVMDEDELNRMGEELESEKKNYSSAA